MVLVDEYDDEDDEIFQDDEFEIMGDILRYKWQHVLIQKFPLLPTCTRKDGTTADDEASHVVASLKDFANDSTNTPDDQDYFTNGNNLKVKGPEKRGYVRLVGRMLAAKSNGASSTESETINQLKVVVNAFAMIIQDHIPIANFSSALSNPNVQVLYIGSSSYNNSLSVNQISSSRSHNDNGFIA